jgi:hypothetical protein
MEKAGLEALSYIRLTPLGRNSGISVEESQETSSSILSPELTSHPEPIEHGKEKL